MKVELWTDGSGTTRGPIGWAYVLRAVDPLTGELRGEHIGLGGMQNGTNNRAELAAVLAGLRVLNAPADVQLYSDSEYVVKPFSEAYLLDWAERGWRKKTGGAVANADLWRAILDASTPHAITAHWVEGHSGIDLNERCDRLAGAARAALIAELSNLKETAAA